MENQARRIDEEQRFLQLEHERVQREHEDLLAQQAKLLAEEESIRKEAEALELQRLQREREQQDEARRQEQERLEQNRREQEKQEQEKWEQEKREQEKREQEKREEMATQRREEERREQEKREAEVRVEREKQEREARLKREADAAKEKEIAAQEQARAKLAAESNETQKSGFAFANLKSTAARTDSPKTPASPSSIPKTVSTLKPASTSSVQPAAQSAPLKSAATFSSPSRAPLARTQSASDETDEANALSTAEKKRLFGQHPKSVSALGTAAASPATPTSQSSEDLEELDERALAAAEWVNKEIRKLIVEIRSRGAPTPTAPAEISFGQLFYETDNIFEALAGTLKTAKKYGVVDYEGDLLFQGKNDATMITLLKEQHDGIEVKKRRRAPAAGKPPTTTGFGGPSLQNASSKCHICTKTVYPMEFVGASGKAFHKNCFRCETCKNILKPTDYCTNTDKFYCTPHYTALFYSNASY
eukprot:m.898444 g.898444  ORF g.898444 m.898444 type:complete len:477 (+) comp60025_c0_seq10:756-2186(+)